jgi:hypothetical protein
MKISLGRLSARMINLHILRMPDSCAPWQHSMASRISATTTLAVALTLSAQGSAQATTWELSPLPTSSLQQTLTDSSCPTATFCISVGYAGPAKWTSDVPLAESFHGTHWALLSPPAPAGFTFAELDAISCVNSRHCVAVGAAHMQSGPISALVEIYNRGSWKVQLLPLTGQLHSISCVSVTFCVAVGQVGIEMYDGSTWATAVASAPGTLLNGVSCSSRRFCMAVGRTGIGPSSTLAEEFDGKQWLSIPTPALSSSSDTFTAVSCPARNQRPFCAAVGSAGGQTFDTLTGLVETFGKKTWAVQQISVTDSSPYAFQAVACVSATACSAGGVYFDTLGGDHALIADKTGSTWSAAHMPEPQGAQQTQILGASCSPRGALCIQVGNSYNNEGSAYALVGSLGRPISYSHTS